MTEPALPTHDPWHHKLDDIVKMLPAEPRDDRYCYPISHGTMKAGVYAPEGRDGQCPHSQDELYIIISGTGSFTRGATSSAFGPGDLIFVPAGMPHRFVQFTADFSCWVVFWGADGGEPGSGTPAGR